MRARILLLFISLLCSSATFAFTYEVATADAPPFYTIDRNRSSGILIGVIKDILGKASIDYILTPYSTKEAYKNIVNGKSHIYLGPTKSDMKGFDKSTIVSSFSPIQIELNVYSLKESSIRNKRDFRGRRIALVQGYSYGGLARYIKDPKQRAKYYEVEGFKEGIKLLLSKKVDAFLDYTESEKLHSNYLKGSEVYTRVFNRVPLYFIISKKAPNYLELMKKIQKNYRK